MGVTAISTVRLLSKDGSVRGTVKVDGADADWLGQWRWGVVGGSYAGRTEYVRGENRSRIIYMHRALLGLEEGDERQVDHINRDRLDNRRANLRIVTTGQQMQNRPSPKHARSRHRGVTWCSDRRQWRALVTVDGKRHLGRRTHDELEAAAEAKALRERFMTHAED